MYQAPFDGHHATILMKSNELFFKNCHKLNLAFIFVCFFGGFAPAICLTGCGNSHIPSPSVSAIENSIDSPSGIEESVSGDNDNGVTIISDSSSLAQKTKTIVHEDLQKAAAEDDAFPIANTYGDLCVPTYINKIGDTYFLVDCYHNQVIYHDNLEDPIWQWNVLPGELAMPHTIASDGTVYLVDDTENHRVVVYEKYEDHFLITQTFDSIGSRPHFIQYNEADRTFYVWSSMTGEMYLFQREDVAEEDLSERTLADGVLSHRASAENTLVDGTPDAEGSYYTPVKLVEIRKMNKLDNIYVRSFTIMDDEVYFVSGNSTIIRAKLSDFTILEEYPVPAELAGMIQLTKIDNMYYLTISTDITGNQDFATIIRAKDLKDLISGDYEDIYDSFVGGGTPYYISEINGTYYMTEHRIPGHSLWSFRVEKDELKDITAIY